MPRQATLVTLAVIDSSESILDAIKTVLELEQWKANVYTTAQKFLSDMNKSAYSCDFIILDPHLPDMEGAELAQIILQSHPTVPIIGLTADPSSELSTKLKQVGARAVLTKPVSAEALVDHIQAGLTLLH